MQNLKIEFIVDQVVADSRSLQLSDKDLKAFREDLSKKLSTVKKKVSSIHFLIRL
jgi:hypothetical protein